MSILAFMYSADNYGSGLDEILGKSIQDNDNIAYPSYARKTFTRSTFGPKAVYNLEFPEDTTNYHFPPGYSGQYPRTAGVVPDTAKELWLRIKSLSLSTSNASLGSMSNEGGQNYVAFYNWNGTRLKLVAKLTADNNGQLKYITYTTTEGTDTADKTYQVATGASLCAVDVSTYEVVFDIRFYLDPVAGFVQVYDRTVTRVGECIGPTTNSLPITHAVIFGSYMSGINSTKVPVASILADEPTFGMEVVPLRAKSNGSHADQLSGDFTPFSKNYGGIQSSGLPIIEYAAGTPKRSSFKFKTPIDVGAPTNASVLTVEARFSLDAIKKDMSDTPLKLFAKNITSGKFYEKTPYALSYNVNTVATNIPQVRQFRLDKNPETGLNWTQGDLADFEFGITYG